MQKLFLQLGDTCCYCLHYHNSTYGLIVSSSSIVYPLLTSRKEKSVNRDDPFYGLGGNQGFNVIRRRMARKGRLMQQSSRLRQDATRVESDFNPQKLIPAPSHKRRRESKTRVWLLVSTVLALLLVIMSVFALVESHLAATSNPATTGTPTQTRQPSPTLKPSPTPKPLCISENKSPDQIGVWWFQIKPGYSIDVFVTDGSYARIILFANQQTMNCWAAAHGSLRHTLSLIPGHKLFVFDENPNPGAEYQPIRKAGSWALIVTSGPMPRKPQVKTIADARADLQQYYDNGASVWKVNGRLTKLNDKEPVDP